MQDIVAFGHLHLFKGVWGPPDLLIYHNVLKLSVTGATRRQKAQCGRQGVTQHMADALAFGSARRHGRQNMRMAEPAGSLERLPVLAIKPGTDLW
eukprot:1601695-Heterocapsa_arctica.AAC.1